MILCEKGGLLVSDSSLIELHAFAASIGEEKFVGGDRPRYELATARDIDRAVRAGARLVSAEEVATRLASSGLWKMSDQVAQSG